MEIYSNSTRFALACNTSSKIIEPIQSRCALVRFSRLSDQEILGRLMIVVQAEKVNSFGLYRVNSAYYYLLALPKYYALVDLCLGLEFYFLSGFTYFVEHTPTL